MDFGNLLPSSVVLLFKELVQEDYPSIEKMGDKSVSQIIQISSV